MDKSAIRNFAIEARKMLMKSAETEAGFYGVTKNGCKSPFQKGNDFEVYETIAGTENRIYGADIKKRANLVKAVETLGFEQVIEETAYTWFNRIIAIRFMEVNDYLPTRVRVLSSETGSNTPDIVTQSLDVELNMTPEELEKVQKAKDENRYDDAFRMLFIKQCNELNTILPGLFEKTDDYMELLLKLSYTSDGVVRMLVDSIDENNFNVETEGQVEIIGWMYQYYNTELKDDTFVKLKNNIKISKERIPAATQLFTPDWIVRYMVENSVGRVWIEHLRAVDPSIDEKEKAEEYGWKYYLAEAEQQGEVQTNLVNIRKSYLKLEPKDINCIDPCMGSGHILVYMFDVLMDIYRSEGFSERDAVFSILLNNIRGLDIDRRAYQLSYFALMMKARGYNRTFFRGMQDESGERHHIEPMVLFINESNEINRNQIKYFGTNLSDFERNNALNQIDGLLDTMIDGREYGSILEVEQLDWSLLERFAEEYDIDGQISFDTYGIDETQAKLLNMIKQGKLMADKYWVVSTNPPYMGLTGGTAKLNIYVKKKYPDSKTDMFAVFIEKCGRMLKKNAVLAMITQHTWMFISTYEKLRTKILNKDIISMAHLGARAFEEIAGEVVQTVSFIVRNSSITNYYATYSRLVEENSQESKRIKFLSHEKEFFSRKEDIEKIPGIPFAYWVGANTYEAFNNPILSEYVGSSVGIQTGDNEKFLHLWWEIDYCDIQFGTKTVEETYNGLKWYPYNKGGEFRKWYGNNEFVISWRNDGEDIKENSVKTGHHYQQYADEYKFKPLITWSRISTGTPAFRYRESGSLSDMAGFSMYATDEMLKLILGYSNSSVAKHFLSFLAPTLNFMVGPVTSMPFVVPETNRELVLELVNENISIAQEDWNNRETSMDFQRHPVMGYITKDRCIQSAVMAYQEDCKVKFDKVKANEERINSIFIQELKLEDEVESAVEDINITISIPDEKEIVKSFISYLVGCMFGRYDLQKSGVVYTGGAWNPNVYKEYQPDVDGIIPISDAGYFQDDIVNRIEELLIKIFGKDTLEDNLLYMAKMLGEVKTTPREALRNYFLNDFYKEHCSTYSVTGSGKRPIYWLFDSGKQNGFKCLIYMHRYNKDTLNLIRSEYLHKTEDAVENALKNAEYIIQTSASAVERAKATKDRDRYVKQLNEMRIYYQALSHLALQKIEIDLDDGVKHNYQLFQGVEVIADGGKKQKVDLLAKI